MYAKHDCVDITEGFYVHIGYIHHMLHLQIFTL